MGRSTLVLAIAAMLFWLLVSTFDVRAQDFELCEVKPDGSIVCCVPQDDGTELCTSSISSTLTPFVPTATLVPTLAPTVAPTATPTVSIRPFRRYVYLPIGARQ